MVHDSSTESVVRQLEDELRRTRDQLRISEERFRLAVRIAPLVVLGQDTELRYTWGYVHGGEADFIGRTDDEVFPPVEAERLTPIKRQVLDSGVGQRVELPLTFHGCTGTFDLHVEPIRRDGDAVVGVTCVGLDVSASKDAEHTLREADRRKDEFLATLAHELRTPLAPLRSALDVQKMAEVDTVRVARARDIMDRQLNQIVRLVDDLLDLSRITQGKIQLRRDRFELAAPIETALEATRDAANQARHRVTVHVPDQRMALEADFTRLTQIITNLVSNAIKYTPPGGEIELTAGHDAATDLVTFRIRDNGIGIAPEVLPRVFDLFAQADDPAHPHSAHGGLGVGLNLVKRVVELYDGTVEAHSAGRGAGSEFVVRLPYANIKHA